MRDRRLFWDAEGRRCSRNPKEKSTHSWADQQETQRFLLDYILRERPDQWEKSLVKFRIVSEEYLRRLNSAEISD